MTEQLRAQIWKQPDDRAVLGVYADWLATQGETTRAEYMQLALLARPTAPQRARRDALHKRHRGEWLGAARRFVYTWEVSAESPGFIARVQCSMPKLVAGFDVIRALGPRLTVSVTGPKAKREVVALGALPLGKLYGLALHEADMQFVTDELMATIAPNLDGLRALTLHAGEARASDRGWQHLLPHLVGLERLDLTMGDNPERWLELLLASPVVRSLTALSVPGWIDKPLQTRLTGALALGAVEFRKGERRVRFDRATGYYI